MSTAALKAQSMGQPLDRVDGRLKVTGAATYPAEFHPAGLLYGHLVTSRIARGTITAIDSAAAEKAPGVRAVLTHLNAPKLPEPPNAQKAEGIRLEQRVPFSDARISYGGQYVGVVVADTLEQARFAADLLTVSYAAETPALRKEDALETKQPAENNGEKLQFSKGDVEAALKNADFTRVEQTYSTPTETHNPMENSATIASWESPEKLVLYDATQYVKGAQSIVARAFGLKREDVRVICPFVGGAFGCKGPVWPHTLVAAMAARAVGKPVRIELTRAQMFSGTGHRSATSQRVALAASKDGRLQAIRHQSDGFTSPVGMYVEACGIGSTHVLYDAPAIEFGHTIHTVNIGQSSFMRAPGECPGTYAVECAMDELATALALDPLELRMLNNSPNHPTKGIPFSTKFLGDCYKVGAEKFGWGRRQAAPRSMKDGRLLVGWGVATATYPANQWAATVWMQLTADGTALVRCATHDLGTGASTAFTQISADALGLPAAKIKFELGSSDYPFGPVAGGSNSTATVGSAIVLAARALQQKLADLAVANAKSTLYRANAKEVVVVGPGRLGLVSNPGKSVSYADVLSAAGLPSIDAEGELKEEKNAKSAFQSFGAQFCEVKIDPDLPLVHVTRFVSVMDCGRVINSKLGASQILGGIVMGIGMALEEETHYDPRTGLPVTRNLADYHVPVHADINAIDVTFVGEPDLQFNPMGARGMGEIGNTGTAAAVANAVFHATGRRVRDLPITPDKLL